MICAKPIARRIQPSDILYRHSAGFDPSNLFLLLCVTSRAAPDVVQSASELGMLLTWVR